MTSERDRAKTILKIVSGALLVHKGALNHAIDLPEKIATQIREAVEEANEALKQNYKHWTDTAMKVAYEDAAKIAESEIETWDKVENFERVKQCEIIAECIRARAKEVC